MTDEPLTESPLSAPPTDEELDILATIINGGQIIRELNHLPRQPLGAESTMLLQLIAEVRRLREVCSNVESCLAVWESLRAYGKATTYQESEELRRRLREANP